MTSLTMPHFSGGQNIAMKVPSHLFESTVAFYRDGLRLPVLESAETSVVFEFGTQKLWVDRVDHLSQAEVWLELVTGDVSAASSQLAEQGVSRRDEIEALPEGFEGFWIANPAQVIHLVRRCEA